MALLAPSPLTVAFGKRQSAVGDILYVFELTHGHSMR